MLTIILLGLSLWTAYANVFSDDVAVRATARETANAKAGCGDKCKLVGMRGERGMFDESIEYDIDGKGHFAVTCRRQYLAFGDYTCKVE